jgi:hypothetical protein
MKRLQADGLVGVMPCWGTFRVPASYLQGTDQVQLGTVPAPWTANV